MVEAAIDYTRRGSEVDILRRSFWYAMLRLTTILVVFFGAALCGWLCVARSAPIAGEGKATEIALDRIKTTSRQVGLQRLTYAATPKKVVVQGIKPGLTFEPAYGRYLYNLEQGTRSGLSQIYIVESDEIAEVLRTTQALSIGMIGHDSNPPKKKAEQRGPSCWLAAFLGIGPSDPPAWVVKSVTVSSTRIRLTYSKGEGKAGDPIPHYYWAPLGAVTPGAYDLELFDQDVGDVLFSVRRKIPYAPQ
jgi:hypothetical protein